jgi:2-polyprenyl-3-methyl-5-hydroxy-6-metoxy-1,4-benzoquinol methylase
LLGAENWMAAGEMNRPMTGVAAEADVLDERQVQPEMMDAPDMAGEPHAAALRGLERINAWSRSAQILWPELAQLARRSGGLIRVLDVATGGGDLPARLWHKARRAGLNIKLHGVDRSASAIEYAQQSARERKADVRFSTLDVFKDPLPIGYDVVMCSLFLHHLSDSEAELFLKRAKMAARQVVLVNDLRRCASGFLLAWAGSRVLSRSRIVHIDGPLSVRAAFTIAEVQALVQRAGLEGATIMQRWPCRYLLTWRRP